jgi:hypothetical protein
MMSFLSLDLLLGKGEENDNEKKWEVLKIIYLATSQNGMSDSQLARSIQPESSCI